MVVKRLLNLGFALVLIANSVWTSPQRSVILAAEDQPPDVFEVAVDADQMDVSDMLAEIKAPPVIEVSNARAPPPVVREAAPVTSQGPGRLTLSPASRLYGAPGEIVNLEFLLTNVGQRDTSFVVSAREQMSNNGVNFPMQQFLYGLSERKPSIEQNETRTLVVTLRVPTQAPLGMNKTISLEVQPRFITSSGSFNMLTRKFYFTVGPPSEVDNEDPTCTVVLDTMVDQCSQVPSEAVCNRYRWTGQLKLQDSSSGLRSIIETPTFLPSNAEATFYSHDNYIIGTNLETEFFIRATCCVKSVSLAVTDVAGNQRVCSVGENSNLRVQLGTLGIVTIVVVIVLVLVIIAAIIAVVVIRRRRHAELAEMRESPQAR